MTTSNDSWLLFWWALSCYGFLTMRVVSASAFCSWPVEQNELIWQKDDLVKQWNTMAPIPDNLLLVCAVMMRTRCACAVALWERTVVVWSTREVDKGNRGESLLFPHQNFCCPQKFLNNLKVQYFSEGFPPWGVAHSWTGRRPHIQMSKPSERTMNLRTCFCFDVLFVWCGFISQEGKSNPLGGSHSENRCPSKLVVFSISNLFENIWKFRVKGRKPLHARGIPPRNVRPGTLHTQSPLCPALAVCSVLMLQKRNISSRFFLSDLFRKCDAEHWRLQKIILSTVRINLGLLLRRKWTLLRDFDPVVGARPRVMRLDLTNCARGGCGDITRGSNFAEWGARDGPVRRRRRRWRTRYSVADRTVHQRWQRKCFWLRILAIICGTYFWETNLTTCYSCWRRWLEKLQTQIVGWGLLSLLSDSACKSRLM